MLFFWWHWQCCHYLYWLPARGINLSVLSLPLVKALHRYKQRSTEGNFSVPWLKKSSFMTKHYCSQRGLWEQGKKSNLKIMKNLKIDQKHNKWYLLYYIYGNICSIYGSIFSRYVETQNIASLQDDPEGTPLEWPAQKSWLRRNRRAGNERYNTQRSIPLAGSRDVIRQHC